MKTWLPLIVTHLPLPDELLDLPLPKFTGYRFFLSSCISRYFVLISSSNFWAGVLLSAVIWAGLVWVNVEVVVFVLGIWVFVLKFLYSCTFALASKFEGIECQFFAVSLFIIFSSSLGVRVIPSKSSFLYNFSLYIPFFLDIFLKRLVILHEYKLHLFLVLLKVFC